MPKNKDTSEPEGKEKTSIYLKVAQKKDLKFIMYKEEKTFTDIVEELLTEYISKWEKKNGAIPR